MRNNKFRFTNRTLQQLPPLAADSPSRSAEYSDTEVIGLRILVNKQSRKYFYFRFVFDGQKRAAKIGEFPALEVQDARKLGLEMRAKLDRGLSPVADHDRAQDSPTFKEFAQNEYLPFARQTKRSANDDECRLRVQAYPRFASRKLVSLQTREIQQYHADLKDSHCPATANRHLALLSRMYKLAVQWGRADRNPCVGIAKFKESNSTRFLTPDEIQRMYKAMENEPNKTAVAAMKFLLLTGSRLSETLQAKWGSNIDLENCVWYIPLSKSGRGRFIQLNSEAKALLKSLPRIDGSPWVFPSPRDPGKAICDLRKPLARIMKTAGIVEHLRLHDFRHTYASLLVNSGGTSLAVIQGLLGHSSPLQTMRYSHLMNSTLRDASQSVADIVNKASGGAAPPPDAP